MLVAISILILLITSLTLVILQWRMEDFKYANFIAGGASILAWMLLLFARTRLPIEYTMSKWGTENFFPNSPALLIDTTSWALALSMIGFGAAVAFSNHEQIKFLPTLALTITAAGVLAAFSANPITLLYLWSFMEVLIFLSLLYVANAEMPWSKIVSAFTIRLFSLAFIMGAGLLAYRQGHPLTFAAIPPSVNIYLIVAAVLNFGIWLPTNSMNHLPGIAPLLRLTPTAISLVLIARTAESGLPDTLKLPVLYITIGVALLSGFVWVISSAKQPSLQAWILSLGSLSIGAALLGHPHASLAWALALFVGSAPFLVSNWSTPISILGFICFLGLSALPFTPAWAGSKIYNSGGWGILFGGGHGLLLVGYLNIIQRRHKTRLQLASWEVLSPVLGLSILPITQIVASLAVGEISKNSALGINPWGGTLLAGGVVISGIVINYFPISIPEPISKIISVLSRILHYVSKTFVEAFKILFALISRLVNFLAKVFEGEGGVIWTLVGAFLLITILMSLRGG